MGTVIFAGDINVDLIMGGLQSLPVPDREITCKTFDITLGSSAVITACAFAALGGDASILGLAGNDEYGDFMLRGMEEFGINTSMARRAPAVKTGVTVNLIHGSQRTQVTYPGTITEFDGAPIGERDLSGALHIHFSGPYMQHRFRPHITRLLKIAQALGMTTSLDPQWDATEKWEFMDEWLPLLTYFFPNHDEAISLTRASSAEDACRVLAGKTSCPVVKVGAEGAMVWDKGEIVYVRPPRIRFVDPTGAGDSLAAGFLFASLLKQMNRSDALRFGTAVAARSCTFAGGTAARSSYDDIVQFMQEHH